MPKIAYITKRFSDSSLEIIEHANEIIEEYEADGFGLTLRQLYYQFVARDLIPNLQSEYKRLGSIINDGRLAGFINWHSIVDRTRHLEKLPDWEDSSEIIEACANQFRIDKWASHFQEYRPEVWIEKDALTGVISGVCEEFQVPYFSCRGYTSQSETWRAGQRMLRWANGQQDPFIIHLGDHDPSGLDMTRDIGKRVDMFTGQDIKLERIALNMDQIEKYGPPPNPTKTTDTRAKWYIAELGEDSWELDALEPRVISELIRKTILSILDSKSWQEAVETENDHKAKLQLVAERWSNISL